MNSWILWQLRFLLCQLETIVTHLKFNTILKISALKTFTSFSTNTLFTFLLGQSGNDNKKRLQIIYIILQCCLPQVSGILQNKY